MFEPLCPTYVFGKTTKAKYSYSILKFFASPPCLVSNKRLRSRKRLYIVRPRLFLAMTSSRFHIFINFYFSLIDSFPDMNRVTTHVALIIVFYSLYYREKHFLPFSFDHILYIDNEPAKVSHIVLLSRQLTLILWPKYVNLFIVE